MAGGACPPLLLAVRDAHTMDGSFIAV